jgi:pyruvate formate lyase activating enzyme
MGKVKCELCPTECVLGDYEVGGCRVRINRGGVLYSLVYGKPCSAHIDPIEKKPFYHFLPGTKALSIATVGCVLGCKFCQNWEISQAKPEETDFADFPPDDVVRKAIMYGTPSVCYTYTEPAVFYEYMYDTCVIAREHAIRNTMHSCGYINEKPLRKLAKVLDAADIDLKSFTEDFYGRVCGGRLKPVLDAIMVLKEEGVWLEITNLVIPTLNDDMNEIRQMSRWLVRNAGSDVPLHFSRFFPYYKLKNLPPTPVQTLFDARQVAMEEGLRYVYIGNLRSEATNTYCHNCRKLLVGRVGYFVGQVNVRESSCIYCGARIPGVWGV